MGSGNKRPVEWQGLPFPRMRAEEGRLEGGAGEGRWPQGERRAMNGASGATHAPSSAEVSSNSRVGATGCSGTCPTEAMVKF